MGVAEDATVMLFSCALVGGAVVITVFIKTCCPEDVCKICCGWIIFTPPVVDAIAFVETLARFTSFLNTSSSPTDWAVTGTPLAAATAATPPPLTASTTMVFAGVAPSSAVAAVRFKLCCSPPFILVYSSLLTTAAPMPFIR